MPLGKDIDELLSGYLDDQLTLDERRTVEAALQDDRSLAVRLGDLRKLSRRLHVVSQLPVKGLPADFTHRVLAQCSETALSQASRSGSVGAASLEASPQADLPESMTIPSAMPVGSQRQGYRRVAAAMAALAGLVLLAVGLPRLWHQVSPVQPLVDGSSVANSDAPNSSPILASGDGATPKLDPLGNHSLGLDPASKPAFPDGEIVQRNTDLGASEANDLGPKSLDTEGLAQQSLGDDSLGRIASERSGFTPITYALVLDLEITETAAEQEILRSLFAKYGIELAVGVPLNSDIEKAVNRMRYTVRESQQSKPAELYLVRAPSAILDAAVGELEAEVQLVPGYRFDLAFQTPTVSLSQAIADSIDGYAASKDPMAVPVIQGFDSPTQAVSLESIPYQGTLISSNRRRESHDSAALDVPRDGDTGYLLILVRQQ